MENKKIVWKLFAEWNFDKEQDWLNDMADQGWLLTKVSGMGCRYEFEPCTPGEYTLGLVKLNTQKSKKNPQPTESEIRTAEIIAEGAELLLVYQQWHVFRKKKADGELNLFPNIDERIKHLDTLITEMIATEAMFIAIWAALDVVAVALIATAILLLYIGRLKGKKDELLREKKRLEKEAQHQA